MLGWCAILLACGGLVSAAGEPSRPVFAVSPARPLMDEPVAIRVTRLPPRRQVTVRARSRAQDGLTWRSAAVFDSGADGSLDLTSQAPVSGSYAGVDAMGLFWSMQPDAEPKRGDHGFFAATDRFAPIATDIEALSDDKVLASARVERRFAGPGVHAAAVAERGIVGVVYKPGDGGKHPGVILLGGSEGGIGEQAEAALLASRGFVGLSLGYFGAAGLPRTLQRIPVEYFGRAARWMRSLPEVDPESVAVFGASRGAEAALLAASMFPEFRAVIAKSPSHVRWEGATASELPGGAAWTLEGNPMPFVPLRIGVRFAARFVWGALARTPVALCPMFLDSLAHAGTGAAEIPVERIRGPVMLVCGEDDQLWPSSLMAARAFERLRRSGHPYPDELLSYRGVGHSVPCSYLPTAGDRRHMKRLIGGTPEAAAKAQAESWPKIVRFLRPLTRTEAPPPAPLSPRSAPEDNSPAAPLRSITSRRR